MAKHHLGLLPCSIISNLILILMLGGIYLSSKWSENQDHSLSWSRQAAEKAEEVSSTPCSGHGLAYLDGLVSDGEHVCECYACFTGHDCSSLSYPCVADADSGNPLFLEPFWMKQKESSGVLVSGWHRLGYSYSPVTGQTSAILLEKYIIKLHELVGNAVTQGRKIVFGIGSTQLIAAAVHALSSLSSSKPASVVASIPYYSLYETQTDYFNSRDYEFRGDVSLWENKTDSGHGFIEFVTSPNNPDAQLRQKVLQGPSAKAIHDHVYYWPHYSAIPAPSDEDVMLFSISKLTGHAGSRFGWAVVKDEAVSEKMKDFIIQNTLGVSHDTLLRVLELLKTVVDGGATQLFDFGYETMKGRWERLSTALSTSQRFSLQEIPPQFCSYYKQIRDASPAYAWVKCEKEQDEDCYEVMKAGGIFGRKGRVFGAEDRYVRLSLLKSHDDFESMLRNLQALIIVSATQPQHLPTQLSAY